ncbi:YceG family protein [Clostridium sp. K25]|uniref:YceG family protein n=1 Tax=Clostridium sp. K25 TaxID=1443109 RepID=UPI000A9C0EDF|nr:YceG family protein [Clostridium sp. K25]
MMININKFINSFPKSSKNIFDDLIIPLNKRTGFINGKSPIVPIYFYRLIGIFNNETDYYTNIKNLNNSLISLKDSYLTFSSTISAKDNPQLTNIFQWMWDNYKIQDFDFKNTRTLIKTFKENKLFPILNNALLNSSLEESLNLILELYIKKEPSINMTKLKNFSIKLILWINEFVPKLFKNFNISYKSITDIINPKVLYYGNIKKHEGYFLIFLSLMGSDVIYINSKDDTIFEIIDKNNDFSKIINSGNLIDMKPFPKEELITRHETVAFKASSEIEKVLYTTNDGLFKPWQFENYNINPLTLKTTYDELKLLWNEECRIRPGFNIENNTVYVPNLFAKVSGVHEDINIYWNELKEFKSTKNTLFIHDIPYIKDSYSRYDLYSLDYCFKDGLVNKQNLLNHRLYKFSYLKTSLQNAIIDKINLLLKLPIFNTPINTDFRLKILITILNLNNSILELIQKFDYPFEIPKILIYHNNNNLPSTEDSIILAFLNLMCFDIVIFTPTGYNDIECNISKHYYDTYKLEKVKFNLNIPNLNSIKNFKDRSTSFWSNLFK